jgi:hypothetical protein
MILVAVLVSLLVSSTDTDPITIEKHAPTTQFITFDPKHPPVDEAKLQHGEDALTRMLFNCTVKLKYEMIDKQFKDGKWHVVTRIGDVRVILDLTNTIYLPEGTNEKLRAHEMGHARINGLTYQDAEDAARDAAQDALEKQWEGDGDTPDAAGKTATDAAVSAISKQYLHATADKAFRIGEIYDDLTRHGTNAKREDDAIREATEQYLKERS